MQSSKKEQINPTMDVDNLIKYLNSLRENKDNTTLRTASQQAIKNYAKAKSEQLAWIYANYAFSLMKSKESEKALEYANKAIMINVRCTLAYEVKGLTKFELHKYEDALADFGTQIEIDPSNINSRMNKAICYKRLNQIEDAIKEIDKAINISPNMSQLYTYRAHYYLELGNYVMELNDSMKALELNKNNLLAYELYAEAILELTKDYSHALEYLRIGMSLGLSSSYTYSTIFNCLRKLHKYEELIEITTKYINIYNKNMTEDFRFVLFKAFKYRSTAKAYFYEIKGDNLLITEALADIDKAIEIKGNDDDARIDRALLLMEMTGKGSLEAKDELDFAIKTEPKNGMTYLARSLMHFLDGNYSEAIKDCMHYSDCGYQDDYISILNKHYTSRTIIHDSLAMMKEITDKNKQLTELNQKLINEIAILRTNNSGIEKQKTDSDVTEKVQSSHSKNKITPISVFMKNNSNKKLKTTQPPAQQFYRKQGKLQ